MGNCLHTKGLIQYVNIFRIIGARFFTKKGVTHGKGHKSSSKHHGAGLDVDVSHELDNKYRQM